MLLTFIPYLVGFFITVAIFNYFFLSLTPEIEHAEESMFSTTMARKYVIYECNGDFPCGDLVDRIKGVLNAYAWSCFTNRTLIVRITEPCHFESLLAPHTLNWNLNLSELIELGNLSANFTSVELFKIDEPEFRDELAEIDLIGFENTTDVIVIYTNTEWISAYAKNPYHLI